MLWIPYASERHVLRSNNHEIMMTKLLQLFGLLQALLGAAASVDSTGGFALDTIGALFLCFGILFIVLGSALNRQAKQIEATNKLIVLQEGIAASARKMAA